MTKNNIISSTLLASALTLSSLGASTLNTNQQTIASILHGKGLDKDAAQNISTNFIDDEELFTKRVNNLEKECSVLSKEEIFSYLSKEALHRKTTKLDSYQYLIGMVYDIKQKPLDKEVLSELKNISLLNA